MEERIKPQQPADDGGPAGSEVGVADMREVFPDGGEVPGIGFRFPAEDGQIGVTEQGAAVVPWLRTVVRRQQHQAHHFVHLGGREAGKTIVEP